MVLIDQSVIAEDGSAVTDLDIIADDVDRTYRDLFNWLTADSGDVYETSILLIFISQLFDKRAGDIIEYYIPYHWLDLTHNLIFYRRGIEYIRAEINTGMDQYDVEYVQMKVFDKHNRFARYFNNIKTQFTQINDDPQLYLRTLRFRIADIFSDGRDMDLIDPLFRPMSPDIHLIIGMESSHIIIHAIRA